MSKLKHPIALDHQFDSLIAEIIQYSHIDIVFHRASSISSYQEEFHRIDISAPPYFSTLQEFHRALITLLILSCRKQLHWPHNLSDCICMVGSHMFYGYVLLPSKFGDTDQMAIDCINNIESNSDLFLATLFAQQSVLLLLNSIPSSLVIKQYRQTLGALMKMDFYMFTHHDLSQLSDGAAGGTLQKSEENSVTF
ncbi:TPA: hypothetical protein RQL24_004689 [Vibrio vulnificus]|nr:hypothetical protein [Vibrio vulnificus]